MNWVSVMITSPEPGAMVNSVLAPPIQPYSPVSAPGTKPDGCTPHREAESEPQSVVACLRLLADREQRGGDLVARHVGYRRGLQEPHGAERAVAGEHQAEAQVVGAGGHQAAAAGQEPGALAEAETGHRTALRRVHRREAAGRIGPVHLCQPVELVRRAEKAGVRHAQRREDALLQELVERLPRRYLHQTPDHVGGDAVVPAGAGLVEQRNPVEMVADLRQGARAERRQAGFPEAVVHGDVAGQAGGVAQQIAHRHGAARRRRVLLAAGGAGGHAHASQRRQVVGGRGVQLQPALLAQHHRRHRAHRLGHRVDAENGVVRHGPAARDVHHAVRLEVNHRAVPRHHGNRTGEFLPVDEALCGSVQAIAGVGGEAAVVRPADRRRESVHASRVHGPTIYLRATGCNREPAVDGRRRAAALRLESQR